MNVNQRKKLIDENVLVVIVGKNRRRERKKKEKEEKAAAATSGRRRRLCFFQFLHQNVGISHRRFSSKANENQDGKSSTDGKRSSGTFDPNSAPDGELIFQFISDPNSTRRVLPRSSLLFLNRKIFSA